MAVVNHLRELPDMRVWFVKILFVAVIVLLGTTLAQAGSITGSVTDDNVKFTGTVTGTLATLTIECIDITCNGWRLGDVTLKGFTFTGGPTPGMFPAGYTVENGGQNDDAVGNGGGCNGATKSGKGQDGKAVCWDAALPLTTVLEDGTIFTFTAVIIDGSGSGPLHVQATAYDNSTGSQKMGGKVLAVSDDLGPNTVSETPEPSTFVFLGSGLLVALGAVRRRLGSV